MTTARETPFCPFCAIADGRIKAHKIYDGERICAFLDIQPIRPGHAQIVPREHYDYFEQLPADLAAEILALGQTIAKAQKRIYGVERVGFLFTGGDVAHAHAHLVPLHEKTDVTSLRYFDFDNLVMRPPERAAQEELAAIAADIREQLGG
jgi:histidine triad (HIT) family protein